MSRLSRSLLLAALLASAVFAQTGALTIVTSGLPNGTVNSPYSFSMTASGGTPPYTWSTIGSLPPGLGLNAAGAITGTPTTAGTFSNFTIVVIDQRGASSSRAFSITISGVSGNLAVTTSSLLNGTVNQSYSQTLSATGGTTPYQWAISQGSLPAGLTLAAGTGAITGTPTTANTSTFTVRVTDNAQRTATAQLSITIVTPALTITTVPPLFSGTVGLSYAQTFSASGGKPPYTWTIVNGTTGGLTLDSTTGVLQGTPSTAGTFSFTLQLADSANAVTSQAFSVTVSPPVLTITVGGTVPGGTVGVAYNQKLPVLASGGTPPVIWSILSGSIPGLTFDPATLTLSGVPSSAGTFSFTVQAADSVGLTASRALSITIAPSGLAITSSLQLPAVVLNSSYSQVVSATGGSPPYRWEATGLPAGLTIDPSSGLISGTVTAAGNFGPVITVRDTTQAFKSELFAVNVTLPAAPSFGVSGLPGTVQPARQFPLQISVGSSYPAPITGQAILTFQPESGQTDRTVVFASGGNIVNFTVPTGTTTVQPDFPVAIQTGTVAGTISVSLRLQAGGIDITPSPAPAATAQLGRGAPVITSATFTRSSSGISIVISGYATTREITQAQFSFSAGAGQTLQPGANAITVDVGSLFTTWFQNATNSQYGSQFVLTQPFTIQGDPSAVTPVSVTLVNREGSTAANITP